MWTLPLWRPAAEKGAAGAEACERAREHGHPRTRGQSGGKVGLGRFFRNPMSDGGPDPEFGGKADRAGCSGPACPAHPGFERDYLREPSRAQAGPGPCPQGDGRGAVCPSCVGHRRPGWQAFSDSRARKSGAGGESKRSITRTCRSKRKKATGGLLPRKPGCMWPQVLDARFRGDD